MWHSALLRLRTILCLVEVDGKRAYSCNARARGMRRCNAHEGMKSVDAVLEFYDMNHPLECSVCDQSGGCELQNYTFRMGMRIPNTIALECNDQRTVGTYSLVHLYNIMLRSTSNDGL